ncbi:MAG: hypothetical protein NPIRA03_30850 [Nitrospirales bacterium]|nr:MAG: hypothetical protein NPIRA03_30850 [Nitrospirales bacterium]
MKTGMPAIHILKVKELVSILLLLGMTGCLSTVNIDYDKQADFTTYRTYAWKEGTPANNPLMDRRIITAIDEQLLGKGFLKVDTNSDMVVSYHAATTEEVSYTTSSMGYGYGPAWGSTYGRYGGGFGLWGAGLATGTATPVTVVKGTLVVDIFDVKKKLLLWRGTARDTVHADPEKVEDQIHKATTDMFAKFPPPTT